MSKNPSTAFYSAIQSIYPIGGENQENITNSTTFCQQLVTNNFEMS